jgi:hypothetical protein
MAVATGVSCGAPCSGEVAAGAEEWAAREAPRGLGSKFGGGPATKKERREELDAAGTKATGGAARCGRGVACAWGVAYLPLK